MTEVYPGDNSLLNLISESETGVEYIETGKAPYYLEFRKLLYRLLLATRRANDLRVYDEGGLDIGVKSGKFWDGSSLRSYAGSTSNTLADNKANIYVYLDSSGSLVFNEYTNWPSVTTNHIRLAVVTTSGGDITQIQDGRDHHNVVSFSHPIADSAIRESMLGSEMSGGITTGAICSKRIGSAELKALLDGTTNNLFSVKAGDLVLKVVFHTETASGGVCTIDIGLDAAADGSGADPDGFEEAADANAVGVYSSEDNSYDGVYVRQGGKAAASDGNVTITSSSDQSASSFTGGAYIIYISS
ncbi:MAG: hypothetical protein IID32_02560 [Planctomycetes bacterium]|nr:hypothetical protein [Planctomycetota bacterium]